MKLSRKKSIRLSFLSHKLALALGHDERMALLAELLDELGIDQEQREDSRKSAQHHLHYEAAQRRKAAKKADSMNLDELQASNKEMLAKLKQLLAERGQRPNIDAMSDEERRKYQDSLMHSIAAKLEPAPAPAPEPAPTVSEADTYTVTAKMSKRLAQFDDMTDADQVDALQAMWGCTDGR